LPDPTGLAGTLAAIQNGNIFRDMSGLAATVNLATETAKLSGSAANSAASQATESLKASLTADVERLKAKLSAEVERLRVAADLEKAKTGKPLADKNPTEVGAAFNKEQELRKAQEKQQAPTVSVGGGPGGGGSTVAGSGAGGGSTGSGGTPSAGVGAGAPGTGGASGSGTGGTVSAPGSTGSRVLDRVIGSPEALRSFTGLASDSPVPTPPVTLEGVPLQEWDYFGEGGLQVKDDANAEARSADNAAILETIDKGRWRAVSPDDLKALTLGDRTLKAQDLKDLLLNLSLAPAESVKTLNLVGYALGSMGLTFYPEFVFVRDSARLEMTVEPGLGFDIGDLFELMTTGKFAFLGTTVTLTDARRALPPDGVVNVFNMQAPLSEIFVQTLANFFQVRTTGFVSKPVRVIPTVIGESVAGELLVSKKIDVGFDGDPPGPSVDFFSQLLQQDRAASGAFTAFPRRT
jgi:hypothetical protein